MRNISIREPYASMVANAFKSIETRDYSTSYRGEIRIHAPLKDYDAPKSTIDLANGLMATVNDSYHHGEFIAVANLVDCVPITTEFIETLSNREIALGFYSEGRYAWIFEDVRKIDPVAGRGYPWIWES